MKKFLAFLLALTMLLGVGALAEEDAPLFQQDVMVLFTSDVHCGIESNFGYAGLAMVRDAYKNAGYHVLLVDNGDSIQGEPVGHHDHRRGEHQADERRGLRYRHHGQP